MKNGLPSVIVECILPIHAFLGCDTVSRIYSVGKGKETLKKILGNKKMQACLREFNKKHVERASIARNGEELPSQFYDSTTERSWNSLQNRIFLKEVATATTAVTPETLPCFTHIKPTIKHRYGGVKVFTHLFGDFLFKNVECQYL